MSMVINVNNTTLVNNTQGVELVPLSEFVPIALIFVAICITIVLLNLLAIGVFIKQKSINRKTTYMLMNLAFADFCVGAITGPLIFPWDRELGAKPLDSVGRKWKFYLDVIASALFPAMSLEILAAVSLERLHATLNPIKHRQVTKRVYHVIIAVLWTVNVLINCILVYVQERKMKNHDGDDDSQQKARQSYLLVSCAICFISLLIVGVAYAIIFIKMKYVSPFSRGRRSTRDKKLTYTLFLVTFVSFLTWLPLLAYFLVGATTSLGRPNFVVVSIFRFLTGLNSMVNPIMYVFRVHHFRVTARQLLSGIFHCKNDVQFQGSGSRSGTISRSIKAANKMDELPKT